MKKWISWNDYCVIKILLDIGERNAFGSESSILADACEEAGAVEFAKYIRTGRISYKSTDQCFDLTDYFEKDYEHFFVDLEGYIWLQSQRDKMAAYMYPPEDGSEPWYNSDASCYSNWDSEDRQLPTHIQEANQRFNENGDDEFPF